MVRHVVRNLAVWFFCFVLLPVLLLAACEAFLRLSGYGKSTRPFLRRHVNGQTFYVRNLDFVEQFLSWHLPMTDWEQVEHVLFREKPAKTYRVFVFGESTPEGWPDPQFSFSRFLRLMLEEGFPNVHFEIYNTAFRAVNSHVMKVQAAELAEFNPDLFIVYLGNNEVHGPFGATRDDAGPRSLASAASIGATIWLSDFRLYQVASRIRKNSNAEDIQYRWHNRDCTYWNDPRVPIIYERFARNLCDMCRSGTGAKASVVLCTVPANLRHWRPVGSIHPDGFPAAHEARWENLYAAGQSEQDKGDYDKAYASYEQAAAIEPTFADLQHRLGHCLWQRGEFNRACACFQLALEYDSFPYVRSRVRTNEIIQDVAQGLASQGVELAHVKEAIESQSPHGCPGVELFFDYCHLNAKGAYIMASTLYQTIVPLVAMRMGVGGPDAEPLAFDACMRRLALSPGTLAGYLQSIVNSPEPYDEEAREAIEKELAEAKAAEASTTYDQRMEQYSAALKSNPDDYLLRYKYLTALMGGGPLQLSSPSQVDSKLLKAVEEAKTFVRMFPYHRGSLRLLGEGQARTGDLEGALATFRKTLKLYPRDVTTYCNGAVVLLAMNRPKDAWSWIRKAPLDAGSLPDMDVLYQRMAEARVALGDREGAAHFVAESITLPPANLPGKYEQLDDLLSDKPEKFVQVLLDVRAVQHRKTQDEKLTNLHLGKTLLALRNIPSALEAFKDATKNHQDDSFGKEIVNELLNGARQAETTGEKGLALTLYRETQAYERGNPEAATGEQRVSAAPK